MLKEKFRVSVSCQELYGMGQKEEKQLERNLLFFILIFVSILPFIEYYDQKQLREVRVQVIYTSKLFHIMVHH